MIRWTTAVALSLAAASLAPATARAGEFDELGRYVPDPSATAFEDFAQPTTYIQPGEDSDCATEPRFEVEPWGDALSGVEVAVLRQSRQCAQRFSLAVPLEAASYRATVWMRHGSVSARMEVHYPSGSGLENVSARMAATGRATSDGWVELASNDFSVEGDEMPVVHLRISDFASANGVHIDALELVPSGEFTPPQTCEGVRDPVCGTEAVCMFGSCRQGRYAVPPLPVPEIRDAVVDSMASRLETFFGGRKTRLEDLPLALLELDRARDAETAWQFWNAMATSVRTLHDWHTGMRGGLFDAPPRGRLNACFIEGDADLSHAIFPRDPRYADILVSHAGSDAAGLRAGDRLLAVDGLHPIEWARGLIDKDWGWHVASDADSFADFAEGLGGPTWSNGALILRYARSISVLRCDAEGCALAPETILVSSLVPAAGGPDVACDNRPFYHFETGGPDPATHYVFDDVFQGRVAGTSFEEGIQTMVWDTLYGAGDPDGPLNAVLRQAVTDWKRDARGVILDHRAGNGGTIDSPQYLTELVRPEADFAVLPTMIPTAGYSGPDTAEEGAALFAAYPVDARYRVGDDDYDPDLPVAVVLHRDGSASDYFPYGMKGAEKVRLFSPGPTAGAFSTFIQFAYWGVISFQIATGDTITPEGDALIGHGVRPDQVVEQRQSDLVVGKDSIHEAALAWVRENLKPAKGDAR